MEKLEDLEPGMVLEGVVTNVAAFGAFVDVGVHQDGLVHVSAMSRNFVSDPHSVVKSGDVVRVKVLSVDIAPAPDLAHPAAGRRRTAPSRRPPASRGPSLQALRAERAAVPALGPVRAAPGASGSGRPDPKAPDGALADALRRAGLAPKTQRAKTPESPKEPEDPKSRDDRPGRR